MAPKRKFRDFEFHTKEVDDRGEFSGYLSVYDVIDLHKERVTPGAFENSIKAWTAKGRFPPVLWQHNAREPIGPFTKLKEDDRGLWTEGKLLVDDIPLARQARALMKANVISGMSIGVDVVRDSFDTKSGILALQELDLWEGSIVTFPANTSATVEVVKSLLGEGTLPDIREFEELLRDAGFSRKVAKAIAGQGYAAVLRDAGTATPEFDATSIVQAALAANPFL